MCRGDMKLNILADWRHLKTMHILPCLLLHSPVFSLSINVGNNKLIIKHLFSQKQVILTPLLPQEQLSLQLGL